MKGEEIESMSEKRGMPSNGSVHHMFNEDICEIFLWLYNDGRF